MLRTTVVLLIAAGFALPASADDSVFATKIQPILKQRCYRCHGGGEMADKGGLRLHTFDDITDSETIIAGEPDESEVFLRITLAEDDEERMPKGSAPLAADEIELIRAWIEAGAEMPEGDHTNLSGAVEDDVPPAPPEEITRLADTGALVMPIAMDTNRLTVSFIGRAAETGDADVALITPLAAQVTWLDLGRTAITGEGIAPLASMMQLTRLNLKETAINDDALVHLSALEKLEYLNLYGTKITDAGLAHLEGLKNLRNLYLWQTDVSYDAAMKLQETIEGLEVNLGHDHPSVIRARLARTIELAKQRMEEAAADEEEARKRKEAQAELLKSTEKELEEFEKSQNPPEEESEEEAEEEKSEEKPDDKEDSQEEKKEEDEKKKADEDKDE